MTVWRPSIRVYMWQACIFWTCNSYKTRIDWKINSLIRRKKNRDILRYEFRIAIRYKFFVYCDIPIHVYRYIVTPLIERCSNSKFWMNDIIQYTYLTSNKLTNVDIWWFQKCWTCLQCMNVDTRETLKLAYKEHVNKGAYTRVFPPHIVCKQANCLLHVLWI